jgi:hypothetical protein
MQSTKNATHLPFPVIPPPADASDDGECIDFGTIGKHQIQCYRPGPEYKTQLLIEGDDVCEFINLDITHLSSFNRFNVSFEAQGKTECLRNLRKLIKVVQAMPAVGIPQPQGQVKPLLLTERRAA